MGLTALLNGRTGRRQPVLKGSRPMIKKSLLTRLMLTLSAIMVLISIAMMVVNYRLVASELHTEFEHDSQVMIELASSSLQEAVRSHDFHHILAFVYSLPNTSLITSIEI